VVDVVLVVVDVVLVVVDVVIVVVVVVVVIVAQWGGRGLLLRERGSEVRHLAHGAHHLGNVGSRRGVLTEAVLGQHQHLMSPDGRSTAPAAAESTITLKSGLRWLRCGRIQVVSRTPGNVDPTPPPPPPPPPPGATPPLGPLSGAAP